MKGKTRKTFHYHRVYEMCVFKNSIFFGWEGGRVGCSPSARLGYVSGFNN